MTAMTSPSVTIDAAAGAGLRRAGDVRDFTLAVLAALIAFLGYAAWWPAAPLDNLDLPSYMRVAADMKELRLTRFHQRTPGYPLVMLLTGSDEHLNRTLFHVMLASQLIATLTTAYLLARLGLPRYLTYAVFTLGLLPPYFAPAAYATTESICTLSLVVTFVSLISWIRGGGAWPLALFAVAAAYTTMVRPTFQLLVPAVAAALLTARWAGWTGRLKSGAVLLSMALASIPTLAALGACAYLNHRQFGQWETSSMTARALSCKVTTVLECLPDEFGELRDVLVKHRDELITTPFRDHAGLDYIYRAMPDVLRLYDGDEVKALNAVKKASLYLIRTKPFSFLHESTRLFAKYWMPNDYDVPGLDSGMGRAASFLFQCLVNSVFAVQAVVVVGLMLAYFSVVGSSDRRGWWPLAECDKALACTYLVSLAVILYTMLISCFLGVGETRYRVPTDLLILANTVIGITLWGRCIRVISESQSRPSDAAPQRCA